MRRYLYGGTGACDPGTDATDCLASVSTSAAIELWLEATIPARSPMTTNAMSYGMADKDFVTREQTPTIARREAILFYHPSAILVTPVNTRMTVNVTKRVLVAVATAKMHGHL